MKKRFIISGFLTLVLSIVPFFLISIEVKPEMNSNDMAHDNYYDNIKNLNDKGYRDLYKEKLHISKDSRTEEENDN